MFPILCECIKYDGFVEHTCIWNTYVLWVLPGGAHVAFIHKDLLADEVKNNGTTFRAILLSKQNMDEPCKMISRPFLQILGYKPDYVVITDTRDETPTCITSGYSMPTILKLAAKNPTMEHIRTLAEGPGEPSGQRNQLGQALTHTSLRLATKGFFTDPKYFPISSSDKKCIAAGMSSNEMKLRKLFKVV
jgi:hypothetical protein